MTIPSSPGEVSIDLGDDDDSERRCIPSLKDVKTMSSDWIDQDDKQRVATIKR